MAQSKIEKIASIEEEIRQLKERQKLLKQQHNLQERKDRTKRLCKRMGLFESMLPDTIPLTDEQFQIFLEQTVATEQSCRLLDGLTAQNAATANPQGAQAAAQRSTPPTVKTAHTEHEDGADGSEDGGAAQGRTYIPHECGMCGLARRRYVPVGTKEYGGGEIPPPHLNDLQFCKAWCKSIFRIKSKYFFVAN